MQYQNEKGGFLSLLQYAKYLLIFILLSAYQLATSACFRLIDQRTQSFFELGRNALIIALIFWMPEYNRLLLALCFRRKRAFIFMMILHYFITISLSWLLLPYLDHDLAMEGYSHSDFVLNYTISYLVLGIIILLFAIRHIISPTQGHLLSRFSETTNKKNAHVDNDTQMHTQTQQSPLETQQTEQTHAGDRSTGRALGEKTEYMEKE
mgnify:CR=1 FL=1